MTSPVDTYPLERFERGVSITAPTWAKQVLPYFALALGVALLVIGITINWRISSGRGEDFYHPYVMAVSLVRGFDVYNAPDLHAVYGEIASHWPAPWGFFYTPSTGLALLPLAALPVQMAKAAFFVLSSAVMLFGAHQFLQLVAPRWHIGYRVLVLGALMAASATRWAFMYLQAAPLILGLLCMFIVALQRRRMAVAFLTAAIAVCLKITLGLPFLILAVVQRRYVLAAAIGGTWVVANGLGFLQIGGIEAVRGYQANMAVFEAVNEVNYPDFRVVTSMQRLDWPYLFNAFSPDLPRSAFLGSLISAVAMAWLLWQAWRCRALGNDLATMGAFLGPVVGLSLLSVYHHHYDIVSLLAPAIVYLAMPSTFDRRLALAYAVPVILFGVVYQVGNAEVIVDTLFGDGADIYLRLIGVVITVFSFAVSLVLLETFVRRRTAQLDSAYARSR
jgi:Glycosyltransferase family 87